MPPDPEELLALTRVALTSPAEPHARLQALTKLTSFHARQGDRRSAGLALTAAIDALDAARESAGDLDIAREAIALAHSAESLQRQPLARDAYEVGLAWLGEDSRSPLRGILWQALGNCWNRDHDSAEALRCYRAAAEAKRSANDSRSRLITLTSLIYHEAKWSTASDCDIAIAEAIQVLEEAVVGAAADKRELGVVAHEAGRVAEQVGRQAMARRIYELTLGLRQDDEDLPPAAAVLCDIGDTWSAEGEGQRALDFYRAATEDGRDRLSLLDRLVVLRALANAEAQWGEPVRCELAVAEGAELARSLTGDKERVPAPIGAEMRQLAQKLGRPDLAAAFDIAPPGGASVFVEGQGGTG